MNKFVDSRTIAALIGVSVETIRAWARQGRIPCLRGSQRPMLFDPTEVIDALHSRQHQLKAIGGRA